MKFGHDVPELVEWMNDVVERRIVDLHDWARCDYYNPGMRGRTSIKVVLDALWRSRRSVMRGAVRGMDGAFSRRMRPTRIVRCRRSKSPG